MNAVSIADDFREAHDPHWVLKSAFQLLVFGLVFTEVMLALAVRTRLHLGGGAACDCGRSFDAWHADRSARSCPRIAP